MAAITYLPTPIKVENNHTDTKPNHAVYLCCSFALGILSYYAPRTFLGFSVVNFVYQVCIFNRFVQTDNADPKKIHQWTKTACLVTWSIGTVFVFKSFPFFWAAFKCTGLKEISHLHLIPTITHFVKGMLTMTIGLPLVPFYHTARDLASQHRWVEMEDYIASYPAKVKNTILSSYWEQIKFYIGAFLPETDLATRISQVDFASSQFQSVKNKRDILRRYFDTPCTSEKMQKWPLAIHQFQQLPLEDQMTFGPVLSRLSQHISTEKTYIPFPNAVQAIILNEKLKSFTPYSLESRAQDWNTLKENFDNLDRVNQAILGPQLLLLAHTLKDLPTYLSEPMRLVVAIEMFTNNSPKNVLWITLMEGILRNLSEPYKQELKEKLDDKNKQTLDYLLRNSTS